MSWRDRTDRSRRALDRPRPSPRLVADLAQVLPWLLVASAGLPSLGLARTARIMGVRVDLHPAGDLPVPVATPSLSAAERRRAWLVVGAARRLHGDAGCLRRSLVLARVLRAHDAAVRLGVRPGGAGAPRPELHAWIELAGASIGRGQGFLAFERRPAHRAPAERAVDVGPGAVPPHQVQDGHRALSRVADVPPPQDP